jgi:hypothetical protein
MCRTHAPMQGRTFGHLGATNGVTRSGKRPRSPTPSAVRWRRARKTPPPAGFCLWIVSAVSHLGRGGLDRRTGSAGRQYPGARATASRASRSVSAPFRRDQWAERYEDRGSCASPAAARLGRGRASASGARRARRRRQPPLGKRSPDPHIREVTSVPSSSRIFGCGAGENLGLDQFAHQPTSKFTSY